MNKVFLMWNITQDLELKTTQSWNSVLSFNLATNETIKQGDEWVEKPTFHNIVAWGKKAEAINNFMYKWSKILIEWRIENRSWEAQDWTKRYRTEIILINFEFAWCKKTNTQDDFATSDKKYWISQEAETPLSVEDLPF